MRTVLNERELTGRARTHVQQHDGLRCAMTPRTLEAFLAMRAAAAKVGVDLTPISSFRDFAAQTRIWNRKFRGERPLFDAGGQPMDYSALSRADVIEAILAWSALPGASRHHWGTDFDWYDAARVADRSKVDLLPAETAPGGPFHEAFVWLSSEMGRFGFFRPYDVYRGGFHPEPWHLSFHDESGPALAALTPEVIMAALRAEAPIEGLDDVLAQLPAIVERYVTTIGSHTGPMA